MAAARRRGRPRGRRAGGRAPERGALAHPFRLAPWPARPYLKVMTLAIHAQQLAAPRDVTAFVRKHVLASLQRLHDNPASQLMVFVADAKPGKGGVDQACKMTLRIPGARTMRVESVNTDLHASLLDCARRLKRLVEREVGKQRSTSRSPMHKPLGRSWRSRATKGELTPDGSPSTL